ncbi:MAG: glycosyltransferase family 2 protein [Acidobacteria bacterium]|nr:MAG: glycosyltransferase family 2 protein [Acidobacteriota bacterium]
MTQRRCGVHFSVTKPAESGPVSPFSPHTCQLLSRFSTIDPLEPKTIQGPRLGIVTPLANEETTVDEFLDRVLRQIDARDRVFCVLDRASRDSTRQRIESRSAVEPRIRLVWAPENRCVVDAYFRGYREAVEAGCTWILEMDGGLSHPPELIPRFIEAMESGVDFAPGSRFCPGGSYSGRWSRYLLSKGGTVIANLLLGTRMHDMTSGFECFSRDAMEYVLEKGVESRGHFFQTEIRYRLKDWAWREVPIDYSCPSKSVGGSQIKESFRILWKLYQSKDESTKG